MSVSGWDASRLAAVVAVLVGVGCGPTVNGASSGNDPGEDSSTTQTATGSVTTGPVATTVPPSATTIGPQDTGFEDTTAGVPQDFPEFCSTIEQDCPRGYKCMPYANDGGSSWNDTRCVPIDPDPAAPGEPCTADDDGLSGIDDCDGTSMCWNVDTKTGMGECFAFCQGSLSRPVCDSPCDSCTISGEGVLNICLPGCDPVAQDCDEGQGCYPVNTQFSCAPEASMGAGEVGDPCEFINACAPGNACLNSTAIPDCDGAIGCCAPFCIVGAPDTCDAQLTGTTCQAWYAEEPPEPRCFEGEPGVCALPP